MKAVGLAANDTTGRLTRFEFERRNPGATDVVIDVKYCGVCHSDLHQIRAEWPMNVHYPMVPGHEIVGIVKDVGPEVTKWKVGDRVGVGCMVDSCGECGGCQSGYEQYCQNGFQGTYNCCLKGDKVKLPNTTGGAELLHGGYSSLITVVENFVVGLPDNVPLEVAGPLLCAGITTYSPLMHFGEIAKVVNKTDTLNVGVVGFGGLGHMAIKLAKKMGHKVTVISRSERKKAAAMQLGVDAFVISTDNSQMSAAAASMDLIIDTVSADHDVKGLLGLLKVNGNVCLVGLPPNDIRIGAFNVIGGRRCFSGSGIGGMKETQEMLDFCGKHNVLPDVELIDAADINCKLHELSQNTNQAKRFVIKVADTLTPTLNNPDWQTKDEPRTDPATWVVNPHATIIPPEANAHKKSGCCGCSSSGLLTKSVLTAAAVAAAALLVTKFRSCN